MGGEKGRSLSPSICQKEKHPSAVSRSALPPLLAEDATLGQLDQSECTLRPREPTGLFEVGETKTHRTMTVAPSSLSAPRPPGLWASVPGPGWGHLGLPIKII